MWFSSYIGVGTFQVLAARRDLASLRRLFDYTVARHYPEAADPQALLDTVIAAQARLVAQWMSVGFIHGVMNTDNCALSGETIDYGSCAFVDDYQPDTVFSSIERMGRYIAMCHTGCPASGSMAKIGAIDWRRIFSFEPRGSEVSVAVRYPVGIS